MHIHWQCRPRQCLDPSAGHLYISCHVVFDESFFPYAETQPHSATPPAWTDINKWVYLF